jgi:hypothetical protein
VSNKWRDLTSISHPMPNAAWYWSDDGRSDASSRPASNGLRVPMANASGSDHLDGQRKSKRHETVWGAVASRKNSWNDRWRSLATVPEGLSRIARFNDKRSAAERFYAGCTATYINARACASAIGVTVSVAAASGRTRWKRCLDRKWICVGSASSISLSRINCRLGQ